MKGKVNTGASETSYLSLYWSSVERGKEGASQVPSSAVLAVSNTQISLLCGLGGVSSLVLVHCQPGRAVRKKTAEELG